MLIGIRKLFGLFVIIVSQHSWLDVPASVSIRYPGPGGNLESAKRALSQSDGVETVPSRDLLAPFFRHV